MSQNNSSNNKRIAKNTLFLYLRQFFVLGISLYTSRLILNILGEVDFGIYNVIGGVVALVTTVNFAMTCATTRFLTFQIGRNDQLKVNEAFSNSVIIHAAIAALILLIGEILGPYFINNYMTIPSERITAAQCVFQFSLLTCIVSVISVPYNALVTANEKMNALAYISILDASLRLIVVLVLSLCSWDRLIFYSFLIFCVGLIIMAIYQYYTKKKFNNVYFVRPKDSYMRKEMISYAVWSLIGSSGVMFSNHGLNILLNIFFGPTINAARAVALQVCNAVNNLTSNLYQAIAPQINKSFASGNTEYMKQLIFASSKFTYFLLYIFILPLIYTGDFILRIWLVDVPDHTSIFMYLLLITCIFTALGQPLSNAVGATGNIKKYQIYEGGLQVSTLLFSYFALLLIPKPEIVFIVHVIMSIIIQVVRVLLVSPMIELKIKDYETKVIRPCFLVSMISIISTLVIRIYLSMNYLTFVIFNIYTLLIVLASIYYIGLDDSEKKIIYKYLSKYRNNGN